MADSENTTQKCDRNCGGMQGVADQLRIETLRLNNRDLVETNLIRKLGVDDGLSDELAH